MTTPIVVKSRRLLRVLAWCSVATVLVLALGWLGWLLAATAARDAAVAAVAASGAPASFSACIPPEVPAGRNAALPIAQAAGLLHQAGDAMLAEWMNPKAGRRRVTAPGSAAAVDRPLGVAALEADPATRRATLAQIEQTPWFPLLEQAATLPDCRFPLDYATRMPIALPMPHLTQVRGMVRLVVLAAVLRAAEGEGGLAVRRLTLAARLVQLFAGSDRLLITQLVVAGLDAVVAQGVEECLRCGAVANDADLRALSDLLMRSQTPAAVLVAGLDTDRAAFITSMQAFDQDLVLWSNSALLPEMDHPGLRTSLGRPWLRRLAAETLVLADRTRAQLLADPGWEAVAANEKQLRSTASAGASQFLPAVTLMTAALERSRHLLDLARAAIACERHRMAHRTLPARMEDLDPALRPAGLGPVQAATEADSLRLEVPGAAGMGIYQNQDHLLLSRMTVPARGAASAGALR